MLFALSCKDMQTCYHFVSPVMKIFLYLCVTQCHSCSAVSKLQLRCVFFIFTSILVWFCAEYLGHEFYYPHGNFYTE